MCPSDYARFYIAAHQSCPELEIERNWTCSAGALVGLGVQFRNKHDPDPYRQSVLLVPNDATDTVYHVMFESPARLWDSQWPVAETVFNRLVFDPEGVTEGPSRSGGAGE